ncbi:MAG: protease complex subunit PrcB family protein [Candidatus Binatus sp.]|uniref:protease complex subunit PrcB family protein n=1 Tax=Candidatus Binatus sp. TaxID=2811406 RepID=UPI0027174F24|nr:protease complex subunit PrcB family protein [Candidatus Binatus sp.]MDO8434616.1 protease complex subunit PrcB family protein [Candidatus Binatus sp.]
MQIPWRGLLAVVACVSAPISASAQPARSILPIEFEHSAESARLRKPVFASRTLDDMARPDAWHSTGTATVTFPTEPRPGNMRVLRVDMQMFRDAPAPARNRLSSVNLRRTFDGEDWRAYNRLSLWIKPEVRGLPVLPLQIVLHNDGAEKVPDKYYREGIHYVTLANNKWTQVAWEIEPLALGPRHEDRDRLLGEQDARGAGRFGRVRDRLHRCSRSRRKCSGWTRARSDGKPGTLLRPNRCLCRERKMRGISAHNPVSRGGRMNKLVSFSLVTMGAIVSACSGSLLEPSGPEVPMVRLRAEPYSYTFYSGLATPARIVVRDPATWQSVWTQIHARRSPQPALPAFDFSREMVVVAALGTRSSGGYGILLERASAEVADGVAISVRSSSPGKNCGVTLALTAPVDIASLPLSAGPVRFVERSVTTDCG